MVYTSEQMDKLFYDFLNTSKLLYTSNQMDKLFYSYLKNGLYKKAFLIAIKSYKIYDDYQSLVNISIAYTRLGNKTKAIEALDYAMKKFRPTETLFTLKSAC